MSFSKSKLLTAAFLAAALVAAATLYIWKPDTPPSGVATASSETRANPRAMNRESKLLARWQPLTDDSLAWQARIEIARRIDSTLSETEAAHFLAILSRDPAPGREEDWWVVMNEIMEQMRKHGLGAGQYTEALSAIIKDPANHPVVRDYAVQHLAQWLAPAGPETAGTDSVLQNPSAHQATLPGEKDPQLIADGLETIVTIIADQTVSDTTIPGTALMYLVDASSRLPEETTAPLWTRLDPFLNRTITGATPVPANLRISAIQAAAILNLRAHLPSVRAIASSDSGDPSVRLSSIASLGFYASPADENLLKRIAAGNTRYRFAAISALERITAN